MHLSWGDSNVSQFFISNLIDFIKLAQTTISGSSSNLAQLTPQLDVAFKMLKGLIALKDGPLQEKRFGFLFDLKSEFVDSKPFFTVLQKDAGRSPKFVLLSLAYIAELTIQDESLLKYLRVNQTAFSGWVVTFLEAHCSAIVSTSPLQQFCRNTLEKTTQTWY